MLTDALVQLLTSLLAVLGALAAVRLSHALEVDKHRRRLLFGIEKELGEFRRELERWLQRAQQGDWWMGGPIRPRRLRCTETHDFEISELQKAVGEALERVNVKLAIVREWEQSAVAEWNSPSANRNDPKFAQSWQEMKNQTVFIINDIVSAERTVGAALLMERRSWWRKLLRRAPAKVLPSGYSPR